MLDSGLSASTVIRRHANVRKCLQYALQIGLIKSNPADRVEKPRKTKYEATIYNQAELNALFKAIKGDPLELAVILGAFYGLRRSEVEVPNHVCSKLHLRIQEQLFCIFPFHQMLLFHQLILFL